MYLLERYDPAFSGGLRRLLDEGRVYTRATHDHANTVTAAGYATIATGVHPRRHGIVGNSWYERTPEGFRTVQNSEDPNARIVGVPEETGRSAHRLMRDGPSDWLEAAQPDARIVSVSRKPRGAILPGGFAGDHVYWYSFSGGRFVTSTYYAERDPGWVSRFHGDWIPILEADSVWALDVPAELRPLARRDSAEYENGGRSTFPHRFWVEAGRPDLPPDGGERLHRWLAGTPAVDRATFGLATAALRPLRLGRGPSTDLLALGLSSADAVGHSFGPYSLEQLDNLLRLDRELGDLLHLLDAEVGGDGYVVALSADHGAVPMVEHSREQSLPAERIGEARTHFLIETATAAAEASAPGEARTRAVRDAVARLDFVAAAYALDDLWSAAPADSFVRLYRNSAHDERLSAAAARWGVEIRFPDYWYRSGDGTGHGSPYLYDRRVPLILLGPGIAAGRVTDEARTVDLAPTLAALAGVPYPEDLDGRDLLAAGAPAEATDSTAMARPAR